MAAPPPAGASVAYQPPPISISELLDSKLGADWSAAKFSRFVERSRLQVRRPSSLSPLRIVFRIFLL